MTDTHTTTSTKLDLDRNLPHVYKSRSSRIYYTRLVKYLTEEEVIQLSIGTSCHYILWCILVNDLSRKIYNSIRSGFNFKSCRFICKFREERVNP